MKYMDLDQKGYSMAEYIWIDGNNGVRSKTKVREVPHPVVFVWLQMHASRHVLARQFLSGAKLFPLALNDWAF